MDLKQLKQYIYENSDIESLLEKLNCTNIHHEQLGSLICARLPDVFNSDNPRSIQIKNNEQLNGSIRSRSINGDIYSVVGYLLYGTEEFEEVKDYIYDIAKDICSYLEYDIKSFNRKEKRKDWNYFLRPIQKKRKKQEISIQKNEVADESLLDLYESYLHVEWYNEGINQKTAIEFNIGYDRNTDRITVPIYDEDSNLVGVKGRCVSYSFEKDKKYIALIPFKKTIELFNLHKAMPYIKEKNQVIVFESEKSCLRCWQWGIKNCVAIMGGDLSPNQIVKLKKIAINTEIIFMFDADKTTHQVYLEASKIKNRIVKVMVDTNNLLNHVEKDSPTDLGIEVFEKLYFYHTYKIPQRGD